MKNIFSMSLKFYYQGFYITMLKQAGISIHWKLQTRLEHRGNHMKMNFKLFQLMYKNECSL